MKKSMTTLGATVLMLFAATSVGASAASAHNPEGPQGKGAGKNVTLTATLSELNHSGVSGTASALVRNKKIKHIEVNAMGLTPDAPHAQHIHFGDQALHECPTLAQDANKDGRLNTVEGVPAYGPIVVSLTTTGDTSPASALAVDRFPVAKHGMFHYSRSNIKFTDVAGTGADGGVGTAKQIAEAVRAGEGVVVIHGIDYNDDSIYSLSGEGASELDPSLPAEVTDPVACGVLH
ncbi:hypothetical protein [Marisediminicola antarctica]|uniref:CHRD domain-containing protein n=1 Tax=Marisediminicola antarctica TaxID=674079 RepID=A0A7L5AJ16_9MICO|nr:hypothetical protein [Marisediminicola antarctica]QHO70086.1 hypothetical protein BHD05_10990 [Marisediminicola antarctica]